MKRIRHILKMVKKRWKRGGLFLLLLVAPLSATAQVPAPANLPEPLTTAPPSPVSVVLQEDARDNAPTGTPLGDPSARFTASRSATELYENPNGTPADNSGGPACGNPGCQCPPGQCGCSRSGGCGAAEGEDDVLGNGLLCRKLGDAWTLSSLMGEEPPVTVGGWWQFGYTNNSDGTFNTHPHRFNLHQGWVYVERIADGSKGWDFGGRVDVVYGVDAQNTQAFGNNPGRFDFLNGWDHGIYGWAMPQLYGEVAYGKVSVKLGHFYTLLGYEVVTAPDNFFFSHAFTMNFSEAFTHTGALLTVNATETTTIYAGWTAGWDTGFDRFNGGSNFLGGASFEVMKGLSLTYITTAGNLGAIGDGYSHSIVADWTIDDKWEYVFQSDVLRTSLDFDTIGINQYLFYTICDSLKLGARIEWWKADGTSFYEGTLGLNYKPLANLVIRPEIRYQWAPGTTDANPLGIPENQGIFGIDAIVTY